MTDTEFIIDIGVENSQVGDRIFGQQQALVHQFVDETVGLLFVGADGEQAGMFDRRFENILIDEVEIDRAPGRVRFHAKGHQDETDGFHDRSSGASGGLSRGRFR